MKQKESPIKPGSDIASKILSLLRKKQGDDTLYGISKALGVQQGSLRRKLENPNGWAEIHFINELLDFLGTDYETLFGKGKHEDAERLLTRDNKDEVRLSELKAKRLLYILNLITETKLKLEESLKEMLPVPYTRTVTAVTDPKLLQDIRDAIGKKSPKSKSEYTNSIQT